MGDEKVLSGIRAVLLDLDGVMYRGVQLCHGAAEFVRFARARNIRTFFLSNNSRSGPEVVARKLTGLDVATPAEEVITAAELAVEHLAGLRRKGSVAVIGSDWLAEQLQAAGWSLAGAEADCVLVGLDHQFSYAKLRLGVDALLGGARFVAANRDPVNPIEETLEPGCGALVAALETATGRRASCIGKPSLRILHKALARLQLRPAQTLMVGDSLVSDMALARRGGTHSALLLSGQTNAEMACRLPAARRPDLVLEDLAELQALWQRDTN
ncbi:MAG TPA: HAD-IIA family hydrolase [Chloroflexota bacterium]